MRVWLAIGVAVPSLARLIGVRKANAIIAERYAQRSAGQAHTATSAPEPAPRDAGGQQPDVQDDTDRQ